MRGDLLWEVKTCREMSDANFKLNIRSANLLEAFFGLRNIPGHGCNGATRCAPAWVARRGGPMSGAGGRERAGSAGSLAAA